MPVPVYFIYTVERESKKNDQKLNSREGVLHAFTADVTTRAHGYNGKMVRFSEFLANAIIRRNGHEKDEKSVKYYCMYSVVRRGVGREVQRGTERKVQGEQREDFTGRWC